MKGQHSEAWKVFWLADPAAILPHPMLTSEWSLENKQLLTHSSEET